MQTLSPRHADGIIQWDKIDKSKVNSDSKAFKKGCVPSIDRSRILLPIRAFESNLRRHSGRLGLDSHLLD